MEFAELFGWREALMAIVVVLVIYLLVVLLRFMRLKREQGYALGTPSSAASSAVAAYAAVQGEDPVISAELPPMLHTFAKEDESRAASLPEVDGLADTVEDLARELEQLRREVGGLRAEILVLREALQREPEKPPITQTVSPLYSDAMQMALKGENADSISQYCGISRAEAELVVALVRNGDNDR